MDTLEKLWKITKISPAVSTGNVGDYIIRKHCTAVIDDMFQDAFTVEVPTHETLSKLAMRHVNTSDFAFVCGTNLLASDMKNVKQWNITLHDVRRMRTVMIGKRDLIRPAVVKSKFEKMHVILLGVGWHQYQNEPTAYTRRLLSTLLDAHYIHSVRDSYTAEKLKAIGMTNVVNTACPTMWPLSEAHCASIPHDKAKRVVTTLTNYNINADYDRTMLRMLKKNYGHVFVWIQAVEDFAYLQKLPEYIDGGITAVPPTLAAYDMLLASGDIDYVGTRLHGGIEALNHGRRSLVLAVDNRATEIGKDTNLPVMDRKSAVELIEERINSSWATEIVLPNDNISLWKSQFV